MDELNNDFLECLSLYLDELGISLDMCSNCCSEYVDDECNIQNKINAIHRTKILLSLEDKDKIIPIMTPIFINIILYFDDELVYALGEQMIYISEIYEDTNISSFLSLITCFLIKDEEIIREFGVQALEIKFYEYHCRLNNIKHETFKKELNHKENKELSDNKLQHVKNSISNNMFDFQSNNFNNVNSIRESFSMNDSLNVNNNNHITNIINPTNKNNINPNAVKNTDTLYTIKEYSDVIQILNKEFEFLNNLKKDKSSIEINNYDKLEKTETNSNSKPSNSKSELKELFIEFPFLPGKLSCLKLLSTYYKYINNTKQASFLFGITKQLAFNENLIIKKESLKQLGVFYTNLSDDLLDVLSKNNNFNLKIHHDLIDSCEEIYREFIDKQLDIRILLIPIVSHAIIIFYALEKIENYYSSIETLNALNDNNNTSSNVRFRKGSVFGGSTINIENNISNSKFNNNHSDCLNENEKERKLSVKDEIENYNRIINSRKNSQKLSSTICIAKSLLKLSENNVNTNINTKINNQRSSIISSTSQNSSFNYDNISKFNTIENKQQLGLIKEEEYIKEQHSPILLKKEKKGNLNNLIENNFTISNNNNTYDNKEETSIIELETKYCLEDFTNFYKLIYTDNHWRIKQDLSNNIPSIIEKLTKFHFYKQKIRKQVLLVNEETKLDVIFEYKKFKFLILDIFEHFNILLCDHINEVREQAFKNLIPCIKVFSEIIDYDDIETYDDSKVKLMELIALRLLKTFNELILHGETSINVRIYTSEVIPYICRIIEYETMMDNLTLVIDFLIKDKNYLVKKSITTSLYEIYNFQILSNNKLSLSYLKNNNFVFPEMNYIRDLEHTSVIRRFIYDKDYRVRYKAYLMCFKFGYDYGLNNFLQYFISIFVGIYEDNAYIIRELGIDLTNQLLDKYCIKTNRKKSNKNTATSYYNNNMTHLKNNSGNLNQSGSYKNSGHNVNNNYTITISNTNNSNNTNTNTNSWIYNQLLPKLSKVLENSSTKYQIKITLVKVLILLSEYITENLLSDLILKPVLNLLIETKEASNVVLCVLKNIVNKENIFFKDKYNKEYIKKKIEMFSNKEKNNLLETDSDIKFYTNVILGITTTEN